MNQIRIINAVVCIRSRIWAVRMVPNLLGVIWLTQVMPEHGSWNGSLCKVMLIYCYERPASDWLIISSICELSDLIYLWVSVCRCVCVCMHMCVQCPTVLYVWLFCFHRSMLPQLLIKCWVFELSFWCGALLIQMLFVSIHCIASQFGSKWAPWL